MNIFELIEGRRSVRTFDGRALSPEDAKEIISFADKVENPYDIPITWKLLDAKQNQLSSTVIVGTDTYIAGKMQRIPHAEEAFGYSFEKIVLYAQSLGVGTTWIAGTMDRGAFEKALELKDNEVMPCVSPLGYPANKMSLRETMMRKAIKADKRLSFSELFFDGSFDNGLTKERTVKLAEILEAVRRAPSAVNKQPWRVVVCGNDVHFYEKHGKGYISDNGWDIQKIDIGIALCHFELAAQECGMELSFKLDKPDITFPDETEYIASFTIK